MLFTCGPHDNAAARVIKRKVVKRRGKTLSVDFHCHVHVPAADAVAGRSYKLEQHVQLTSIDRRLADMDAMGVDVQALSASPRQFYYELPPDVCRQTARLVNEGLAEMAARDPRRFVALGTLPLQNPELAAAELEYCIRILGFRGVEIGTNAAGVDFSQRSFDPLFAKAQELGAVIFLHPYGFTDSARLNEYFLSNIIGNPLDTSVALSHLIFGGVLERHPRLKIVAAHGGGFLSHYSARMDHAWKLRPECRQNIKQRPSSYLRKIYFDDLVFSHQQLEHLVKSWGAQKLVLGTDYPFDMSETQPRRFVERAKFLTRDQKDMILGGNAARLLKLDTKIRDPR